MIAGPLWPGCSLYLHEDILTVNLKGLDIIQLSQLANQLGISVPSRPSIEGLLKSIRATEVV